MMKRGKKISAYLLLALYLPMLMIASFHTHQSASCCGSSTEQTTPSEDTQHDGCLLCQFMQTPYDQAPIIFSPVVLPKTVVIESEPADEVMRVYTSSVSLRAPPVLL